MICIDHLVWRVAEEAGTAISVAHCVGRRIWLTSHRHAVVLGAGDPEPTVSGEVPSLVEVGDQAVIEVFPVGLAESQQG